MVAKTNKAPLSTMPGFPVAGVGASAGGLDAFKNLIRAIPDNSGIAWVLVQHQHPGHDSMLTGLLQKITAIPVAEITNNLPIRSNHIYVLPANKILTVKDGSLKLSPRGNKVLGNYPINTFFESLAQMYQEQAIGIVLSGTGTDGTKGLKAIKDHGGITICQTLASAAYPGMPETAIASGVVDFIMAPEKMPKKLVAIKKLISVDNAATLLPEQDENAFKEILSLLHVHKGMDFTFYKQTTVRRRILRRMVLNKYKKIGDYISHLKENKAEINALYQDMLIPVTNFFRDEKTFSNLCDAVFPNLIKNKQADGIIRIWVAGCSTGEEAYSIAICFKEYLGDKDEKVQIFATDLSQPAIAKARTGIYSKADAEAVSHHRIKKFFTPVAGGYQVNKDLRDMCVFAVHNFLKDPPFGKIDFISCRNVLIYMDTYLQKKALTTFHYALNPKGLLILGKSENTIGISDLFISNNKVEKVFTRKDVPSRLMPMTSRQTEPATISEIKKNKLPQSMRTDFQKIADDIMLSSFTPAAVVINEAMDIVHFRGNTAPYLQQAPGKPTHNLLKMAKPGLAFELRNIIHKTIKQKKAVKKENVPLQLDGLQQLINLEVIPLKDMVEPHYLLIFNDSVKVISAKASKSTARTKKDEDTLRLQQLEEELAQLRDDMRSITEEQEASNEELQSSNEELQSSNEELQSLNEELETSKEELQSTVEELTVVNQEMVNLNEQLAAEKEYAEAIIATVPQPMLILDKNLKVITANQLFYEHFLVTDIQTEGRLVYDIGNGQWDIPGLKKLLEQVVPGTKNYLGFEVEHNFPRIGNRIMRMNAREIVREKGEKMLLLAIEDVTSYVEATRKVAESEHRFASMIYSSPYMIAILEGKDMIIKNANETILKKWGVGTEVIGRSLYTVRPNVIEDGRSKILDTVFATGQPYYGHEVPIDMFVNGKKELRYFTFIYQPQKDIDGNIQGVAILANEVTPQAVFNKTIKESEAKYRSLFESMDQGFCIVEMIFDEHNTAIDYRFIEVNPVFGEQTGLKNAAGKTARELVPNLEGHWFKTYGDVALTGKPAQFMEGSEAMGRWFDVNAYAAGEPGSNRVAILFTEISARRNAEQAIKESEERFRTMAESSDILIGVNNETIDAVYFNKKWEELTGKPVETLLKLGWAELLHPDDKEPFLEKFFTAFEKKISYDGEFRMLNKAGTYSWLYARVQARFHPDGAYAGHISSCIDITDRKINEKALQDSELKTRSIIKDSPFPIGVYVGKDLVIEFANQSILDIWGKGNDVIGRSYRDILPELENQQVFEQLDGVLTTGIPFHAKNQRIDLVVDGKLQPYYFNYSFTPLYNAAGEIYAVMNTAAEITDIIAAKQKIEESEKQFRELADQAPMWVWLTDRMVNVLYANTEMLQFMGVQDYTQFTGHVWEQKVHPGDVDLVYRSFSNASSTQQAFAFECRVQDAAGDYNWFYIKAVPNYEAGGFTGFIGTGINMQEQRSALQQLEYRKALLEAHNEASVDGILLVDAKGKILSYNHRFIEIWNMPGHITESKDDEAALAFAMTQLVDPNQFIDKVKWLYENPDKESIDELEFIDGKIIERHGYPVKADDGSYYAWSWMFRDITKQRRSERVIRESEERYHQLITSSPSAIGILKGEDLVITIANDAIIKIWGKGRQIMGKKYFEALPELADQGYREVFAAVYKTGVPFNAVETPVTIMQDGKMQLKYYNFLLYAQRDANNEIDGIGIIATDVTDQALFNKKIQDSEANFRLLAEEIPQKIVNTDAQGQVFYYNKNWTEYTGLTLDELYGDGWAQTIHPDDLDQLVKDWAHSVRTGEVFEMEHRIRNRHGEYAWHINRAVPVKNEAGEIVKWIGAATEIQKIKEEEERKNDFIKMVSHELKTPVTSIKGYVQMLLSMLHGTTENNTGTIPVISSLKRIDEQIKRLTRLITEMLDLSKLEESKLHLHKEKWVLNDLVKETVQDIGFTNKTHHIHIEELFSGSVYADKDRIQQVIINLVNNGIKYSPHKEDIYICIAQTTPGTIDVSVKDFGIGISTEEQEKIFDRFYRVDGKAEFTFSGFGIGLFITREILTKHDGSIRVNSEPGKGSLFTFTLPLAG